MCLWSFLANCHVNLLASVLLVGDVASCTSHPHAPPFPSQLPASTRGGDGRVQRGGVRVRERGRRRQGEVRTWEDWFSPVLQPPKLVQRLVFKMCRQSFSFARRPSHPRPHTRHASASFQDCSSDGPGQPGVQETPETENILQEKEAQDQGSTLRPQSRLSEVHSSHSCMSQLIRTQVSHASVEENKPPDGRSTL